MMRNPLPHLCVDCGFLYRRSVMGGSELEEVSAAQRYSAFHTDPVENETHVWGCRRGVWDADKPDAVWSNQVRRARYCPYFLPYSPGSDPDAHLAVARARLWQRSAVSPWRVAAIGLAGTTAVIIVLVALVRSILT